MTDINIENVQSQMRKGTLEFIILLVISKRGPVYASDILQKLREAQLIVVEGTLYPLLSRLKNSGLLKYDWQESVSGPPRKYYSLTEHGQEVLSHLKTTWKNLNQSINSLIKSN
jgi:PadR family transcriptional regulator PadR